MSTSSITIGMIVKSQGFPILFSRATFYFSIGTTAHAFDPNLDNNEPQDGKNTPVYSDLSEVEGNLS